VFLSLGPGDLFHHAGDGVREQGRQDGHQHALDPREVGPALGFLPIETGQLLSAGRRLRRQDPHQGGRDDHGEHGHDGVHSIGAHREQARLYADDGHDHVGAALQVQSGAHQGRLPAAQAAQARAQRAEAYLDERGHHEEEQDEPAGRGTAELEHVDAHAGQHEEDGGQQFHCQRLQAPHERPVRARRVAEKNPRGEGAQQDVQAQELRQCGRQEGEHERERALPLDDSGDVGDAPYGPEREAPTERHHDQEEPHRVDGAAQGGQDREAAVRGREHGDQHPDQDLAGHAPGHDHLRIASAHGIAL
jgi:hypothetical protein